MKVSDLLEDYKAKPEIMPIEVRNAIDLLNNHCKDGLKAISNNGLLIRGFGSNVEKIARKDVQAAIVDSTKSVRTSRGSNNFYQLMMDRSEALKDYPSRSNSFICTTDVNIAAAYGKVIIMVPFDRTLVAVSSNGDIFSNSRVKLLKYVSFSFKEFIGSSNQFNKSSVDRINGLSQIELLRLLYDKKFGFTKSQEKLNNLLSKSDSGHVTPKMISMALSSLGFDYGSAQYKAFSKALASNKKDKFDILATELATPESLGLKLVKFGEPLRQKTECWFSGKAIALTPYLFIDIINELQKTKEIKIGSQALNIVKKFS